MKPIELKIRGLNSFNEEQIIDFEKLTERGLFGIFGPTGSGKSTVLDGITLALYGEISRKSSNFINTNCDSLSICFKFQISGVEPKIYVVHREFKRDKKTGNPQSGKCKLIDITCGDPLVLAEKVKEVTNSCRDIIGLSLEDFTRTVVLPQGKFSEFLKLEGKARREMLERLFNLQKYGDDLTRKLNNEISKVRTENNILEGQLKGYEGISKEELEVKETELNYAKKALEQGTKELEVLEKEFEENQELWNYTQELLYYKEEEKSLKEKSLDMERYKSFIKLGEAAFKIIPYIEAYEDTAKILEISKVKLNNLKDRNERYKSDKETIDIEWKLWREKKDIEAPQLKVKEEKIKDCLIEKKIIDKLKKEMENLCEIIRILKGEEKKSLEEIQVAETRVGKGIKVIKDSEERFESLKIDNTLKERIQQGILLSEKAIDLKKIVDENNTKAYKLKRQIEETKLMVKDQQEQLTTKILILEQFKKKLSETLEDNPGDQGDLVILQRQLLESKDKWIRYEAAQKVIEEAKIKIIQLESALKGIQGEKASVEEKILALKNNTRELQVENIANSLRKELIPGQICPVCGSMEHHIENIKFIETVDIKKMELQLDLQEKELKVLEMEVTRSETNLQGYIDKIKEKDREIQGLGNEFKVSAVEELEEKFNRFNEKINGYSKKKEELELAVNKLNEEKLSLEANLKITKSILIQSEKQLSELEIEYNKNVLCLDGYYKNIDNLKQETQVEDFKCKSQEIANVEAERDKLESDIKKFRKVLEDIVINRDSLKVKLQSIKESLVKENSTLLEKEKNKADKETNIKEKIGEVFDLDELLTQVTSSIKVIEDSFIKCDKKKNQLEEEFKACNDSLIEIMGKVNDLEKRMISEDINVEKALNEEGFKSIEEVKSCVISKDKLHKLKEIIEIHNNSLAKINGAMESLIKKIDNRIITEEGWISIGEKKAVQEAKVKELNEIRIKIEEEVNFITKKICQLKELVEKRDNLEHKLALLGDLEKLFKGKKFVEFVAAERLKYVSIEASKRLKEISSGNYGLEADENGKFIIRDYKNGGAERDASTLSGGETFLTSLALALALSNEIQLKGTAPLELFFLDEGFGTLDDNLLEIVMSSLERIHNDKLKVGIISHVESIKNRVPVKLILFPAESGNGGSKVKIERS